MGGTIDGVLSVDPVALGLVLDATGPVDALRRHDALRRRRRADAAQPGLPRHRGPRRTRTRSSPTRPRSVFAAVVGGQGDAPAVMDALAEAARQGRLMVWSADEDEQDAAGADGPQRGAARGRRRLGRDRRLPQRRDAGQARLLPRPRPSTPRRRSAGPTGRRSCTRSVTLTYNAPADAAEPARPTWSGLDNIVPLGDIRTNVLIYAPTGGGIESVRVKPDPQGLFAQIHDGSGRRRSDIHPQTGRERHAGPGDRHRKGTDR